MQINDTPLTPTIYKKSHSLERDFYYLKPFFIQFGTNSPIPESHVNSTLLKFGKLYKFCEDIEGLDLIIGFSANHFPTQSDDALLIIGSVLNL